MTIELELAVRSDIPAILEISNWAAQNTAANFATDPEPLEQWLETWEQTHHLHPWLVARSGGEVLGFAKSSPFRSREAYAWTAEASIYIHPEFHGKGIGTALYATLIPLLRLQGYVTLLAGIVGDHAASETLHAKQGFIRTGTLHRVGWKFNRWYDVGFWELALQAPGHVPMPVRAISQVWPNIQPA